MMLSVRSSHSPPFPLTIPPIPDVPGPTKLLPSSIKSALVHTTTIGTPAELCVKTPDPRGRTVLDVRVDVVARNSVDGSV